MRVNLVPAPGPTEFLAVADESGLFDDYLGPELLSTDDAGFA